MFEIAEETRRWTALCLANANDKPSKHGIPGWLRDNQYGLGISFRIRAAWGLSGLKVADFADQCGEAVRKKIRTALGRNARSVTHETIDAVVSYVNRRRKELNIQEEISMDQFMRKVVDGPRAAEDFYAFLRGNKPIGRGLELLPVLPSNAWAPRNWKDLEDKLAPFIKAVDLQTIANIHQTDMDKGLEALAVRLCLEATTEGSVIGAAVGGRPVCYLPGGRNPKTGEKVSLPQMIGWLLAFYDGLSLSEGRAPANTEALNKAMRDVRMKMAARPSIIVIGNATSVGTSIGALRGLILDEPVHQLLPHLAHPATSGPAAKSDPTAFFKTRIIVCSDLPLPGIGPYTGLSYPVPALPVDTLETILDEENTREIHEATVEADRLSNLKKREVDPAAIRVRSFPENLRGLINGKVRNETDLAALEALHALKTSEWLAPKAPGPVQADDAAASIKDYRATLQRFAPEDLLALRFIALSTDGLRFDTLKKLMAMWRANEKLSPSAATGPVPDAPIVWFETPQVLFERHAGLLVQCREQESPFPKGLQTSGRGVSAREGGERDMLDFRSRALREIFLKETFRTMPATGLARMHRFIFEVALARQTDLMRTAPPEHGGDPRFMQRLLQAIFHGLCSVALGKETTRIENLPDRGKVLPADRYRTFIRLYAIFYRILIENPPDWDLTRQHGREALKASILLVAGNVDRMWLDNDNIFYDRKSTPQPELPEVLEDGADDEYKATNAAIGRDLLTNLGRSLFAIGEQDLLRATLVKLTQLIGESVMHVAEQGEGDLPPAQVSNPAADAGSHLAPPAKLVVLPNREIDSDIEKTEAIFKLQIDDLIQQEDNRRARELIRARLERYGMPANWEPALEAIAKSMFAAATIDEIQTTMVTELDKLSRQARVASERQLCVWGNLLSRYAENEILFTEREDKTSHALQQLTTLSAFLAMRLADRFRRIAFQHMPMERSHIASSHSIRLLIRTALRLYRPAGRDQFVCKEAGEFFRAEAKRQRDILTRYYYRHAAERAGICIVESQCARILDNDLGAAELWLMQAEDFMAAGEGRPKLRMGLLFERTTVLLQMATRTDHLNKADLTNLIAAASRDARRLKALAADFKYELWTGRADAALEALNRRMTGRLSEISDPFAP